MYARACSLAKGVWMERRLTLAGDDPAQCRDAISES
jgi:hypothetical protein